MKEFKGKKADVIIMKYQNLKLISTITIVAALWSFPPRPVLAESGAESSAAVFLKDSGVTEDNVDHILVSFQRGKPRWQCEVWRRLFIRWLVRGISGLREGEGSQEPQNGELVIFLKDGRKLTIPLVFDKKGSKAMSIGDDYAIPDRDMQAVFRLLLMQLGALKYHIDKPGPWSDKSWVRAAPFEAELLHNWGRTKLAVEASEEILPEISSENLEARISALSTLPQSTLSQLGGKETVGVKGSKHIIKRQYTMFAEDLSELGRYDDAIKWLETLRELFADDETDQYGIPCNVHMEISATRRMARVYQAKGDYPQAISLYTKAVDITEQFIHVMEPSRKSGWQASLEVIHGRMDECRKKLQGEVGGSYLFPIVAATMIVIISLSLLLKKKASSRRK